jgi:hypothetical protein
MPEQLEHPQRVGRPPVVLVAVDHDGVVARDAALGHQPGEARAVHVVAGDRVVEVGVPVVILPICPGKVRLTWFRVAPCGNGPG